MVAFAKATRDELREIASYVAALNVQREHLVAWLGQHEEEVTKELESLPYVPFEDSFVTARVDGRLVGLIGLYAFPEKGLFRLLGPYVTEGDWQETAEALWAELRPLVPAVCKECRAAIDEANAEAMQFLARHGFEEYNAETSMVLRRNAMLRSNCRTHRTFSWMRSRPPMKNASGRFTTTMCTSPVKNC